METRAKYHLALIILETVSAELCHLRIVMGPQNPLFEPLPVKFYFLIMYIITQLSERPSAATFVPYIM